MIRRALDYDRDRNREEAPAVVQRRPSIQSIPCAHRVYIQVIESHHPKEEEIHYSLLGNDIVEQEQHQVLITAQSQHLEQI